MSKTDANDFLKKVRLGDIANITAGQCAPQGNCFSLEEGVPFVRAGSLESLINGISEYDLELVPEKFAKKYKLKLQPAGTILFAKSGMSCMKGYVYILKHSCYVVNHLACVLPNNDNIDFLAYYFKWNRPNKLIKDESYPSISLSDLSNIHISLPPLSKQQKIANVLGHLNALIKNRKEQIKKLDLLVKAQFVGIFGDLFVNNKGWANKPFFEFAKIDATMTTEYNRYADYPHIGIESIESNTGELKGYRTVKQDGVKSGKYIFTPEHIIYSKIRPNLNKVALPTFEGLCSADAYPIKTNDANCHKVFLAYVLRSDFFLSYILPHSYRTNFPKVNREQILGFSMPLPPLLLQVRFADFVKQVDKSKFVLQRGVKIWKSLHFYIDNQRNML